MPVEVLDELRDQLLVNKVLLPAEVEQAQREAIEQDVPLEAVLRRKRLLTDTEINALRAMRLGVPYCNLSDYIPNLQNAALMEEELARRHVMFPLFKIDDAVTLVMQDPNDLTGVDQFRRQAKCEVEVCMAGKGDILGLIERAYGANKYLEQSSVADSIMAFEETAGGDETRPVIRLMDELINESVRQGASDIHIEPGDGKLRIRIRVDGVLREVAAPPAAMHRALVSRIKIMGRMDIAQTRAPQDGAFQFKGEKEVIIRVSVLPSVYGEAVVMRILRNESEAVSLMDLGLQEAMRLRFSAMIHNAHGMVLVCGPTGSGKSTTLYAALRSVASPQKNIIAIEDPVEYRTPQIRQVQVNPEADLTFAAGLRSILRQDPDVVMVGEIRDAETAQISVQASLTGHLVLSTVHTNDSIGAVARMRDLGVAEYLISASLLGVIAQRLCRKICHNCKGADSPSAHLLTAVGLEPGALDFEPQRGKGCRRCVGSGYLGRCGLYELFEVNDGHREMIVRLEPSETIRAATRKEGMLFLVDDGRVKIRDGLTTVEEVARVAGNM